MVFYPCSGNKEDECSLGLYLAVVLSSAGHPLFMSGAWLPPSPFHLFQESAELRQTSPPPSWAVLPDLLALLHCLSLPHHTGLGLLNFLSEIRAERFSGFSSILGIMLHWRPLWKREIDPWLETTWVPLLSTVSGWLDYSSRVHHVFFSRIYLPILLPLFLSFVISLNPSFVFSMCNHMAPRMVPYS